MAVSQDDFDEQETTPQQMQTPMSLARTEDDDYFGTENGTGNVPATPTGRARRRASLSIRIPPTGVSADTAFTALQYLPMPVLVLSSAKQIVLANDAMARMLGIEPLADEGDGEEEADGEDDANHEPLPPLTRSRTATEILHGATLSQLGLDLLQGGNPVFVAWENFLDTVVNDAAKAQCATTQLNTFHKRGSGKSRSSSTNSHGRSPSLGSKGSKTEVYDAVVEVMFSTDRNPATGFPTAARLAAENHAQAQMIVSVWATEDAQYFTLTFTASSGQSSSSSEVSKSTTRTVSRHSTSLPSGLSSASSSASSGQPRSHHTTTTNNSITSNALVTSPRSIDFPPRGPPGKPSASSPSIFSKTNRLKDAILNTMNIPAYAMWKDESFGVPNKAAIRLLYPWIEDGAYDSNEQALDFLSKFVVYNESFTARIPVDEFPIMRLMREQKGFDGYRIGMYSVKDGSRLLFDSVGQPITDEKGEFLGGLVMFKDVTTFTQAIDKKQRENDNMFENICNSCPVMIWRNTPEGVVNYLSDRWLSYTGTTAEENMGDGWVGRIHPDDMAFTGPAYAHTLATGEEYNVEYRLRRYDGEWRWMLARAVPMRDEDGVITQFIGSCTDIDDLVRTREEAKQTRAQLKQVVQHARITLWAIDRDWRLVIYEGRPMTMTNQKVSYDPESSEYLAVKDLYLGKHLFDILKLQGRTSEMPKLGAPIEEIMSGRKEEHTFEQHIDTNGRWFKTRLFPIVRRERKAGMEGDSFVDGVVGMSIDVTELKKKETEVEQRNIENSRLLAQSVAAREASKMKSQFLANMSHEIRTPIAGVIGMSDLLLDDETAQLTKEQRECAENIQRSANGLLTVINDILDFSKVESGRLDIEEVQFDLNVVVRDVNKMLGFAAERKGLKYIDDIDELKSWKVMGDPGRLRQVMTNLLTNSIKFTAEGSVTMRVKVRKETSEFLEVQFTVEDTGIGIEEDVRKKLFKPFSQADSSTARRFGGTGLGLTISKNLVELMHGQISLESKLGVGTKANFWIPFHKAEFASSNSPVVGLESIPDRLQSELSISRPGSDQSGPPTPTHGLRPAGHQRGTSVGSAGAAAAPVESAQDLLSVAERKNVNVLVVEDNAVNQQIALKTIKKLGFPAKAVWNGKEALDYLHNPSEEQPLPDVILMDVQMPIMDGYRATYTIRNSFPKLPAVSNTPIVAMTASAIQGDREKCEMAGMDDYLAKPVKKSQLESMLVKWAIEGRKKRAELAKNPTLAAPGRRPSGALTAASFLSDGSSSQQTSQDHLSAELDRLEFTQRAALERSAENANDQAIKHQQQEEKAISLRNDVLMESGEDPKKWLGRHWSDDSFHQHSVASGSNALTTENMQRFAQHDRMARLQREHTRETEEDISSVEVTIGESLTRTLTSLPVNGSPPPPSPAPPKR